MSKSLNVKVVVRCRPMKNKQLEHGCLNIVTIEENKGYIAIKNTKQDENTQQTLLRQFNFYRIYNQNSKQQVIFQQIAIPIILSVLQGYNGTIFAYGQAGTGKTFTIEGYQHQNTYKGIIPRAIDFIFSEIQKSSRKKQYLIRVSYIQLYNEKLTDLLAQQKKCKNNEKKKKIYISQRQNEGIIIQGLQSFMITDRDDLINKYNTGKDQRRLATTHLSYHSNRSHSIFMLTIENQEIIKGQTHTKLGKLNFIDLASSEQQFKVFTGINRNQRFQTININISLTTLGSVIQNLVNSKTSNIPYKDSLLTQLLQDSLGGNTKTVMIANIGPANYNYDQTVSTLKYAHRAKGIKNNIKINEDPKNGLIIKFQQQIKKLRKQVINRINRQFKNNVEIRSKLIQNICYEDLSQIQQKFQNEQQELSNISEQSKKKIYLQRNLVEAQKSIQQKQKQNVLPTQKINIQKNLNKLIKMQMKIQKGEVQEQIAQKRQKQLKNKQQQQEHKFQKWFQNQQNNKQIQQIILTTSQNYSNLNQQNSHKDIIINYLIKKLKKISNQNKQLDQSYIAPINLLLSRRTIILFQLKKYKLILQHFISSRQINSVKKKAVWNSKKSQWMLPNLEYTGNSLKLQKKYMIPKWDSYQFEEMIKNKLKNHPNMNFVYTEDRIARQINLSADENTVRIKLSKRSQILKNVMEKRGT